MHQQVRMSLASPSSTSSGPGAMTAVPIENDPLEVPQRALVRVLDLLAKEGYNLRYAGGSKIEAGGEFVFAIDDDGDEDRASKCAAFLERNGYQRVRVVEPYLCEVEDKVGALRDCLDKLASEGRQVDEIFVGTPRDGRVPVHITSLRSVASGTAQGR